MRRFLDVGLGARPRAHGCRVSRALTRGPLVAVAVAGAWLSLGSVPAWADTSIDTTVCATNGAADLTQPGPPAFQNQWGNAFVAPTGFLKSFTANLAADGSQAVTLALFNENSSGPIGSPVWSAPATIASTGSASTFELQTFAIDQPVSPGQSYAFALIPGAPTANAWWAAGSPSPGSACDPGPVVDGYVGQGWLPPLASQALSFKADFESPAPPSASPSPVAFPAQVADTIGDAQTITITSPGRFRSRSGG